MTFDLLNKIIDKYNIPHNVHLLSDSGWECCETEMDGVYYNKKLNAITFTQGIFESEYKSGWEKLSYKNIEGEL